VGNYEVHSSGSGQGPVVCVCEHRNEASGTPKRRISSVTEWVLTSKEGLVLLYSLTPKMEAARPSETLVPNHPNYTAKQPPPPLPEKKHEF
jgi:hypothetical protein